MFKFNSIVEFTYNGFSYNVKLPTSSQFAWSQQKFLSFACTLVILRVYNGFATVY